MSVSVPSLVQRIGTRFVALHDTQYLHILGEEARGQQAVDAQL